MSRFRRLVCLFGVSIACCLAPRDLFAQPSLDDWKAAWAAAEKDKGCVSIPYSDYKTSCETYSVKVEERCKTDQWSCKGLETKKTRENISSLGERLDGWKRERDRMSSDSSGTDDEKRDRQKKVAEMSKNIDEKSKELEEMKKGLSTDSSDIGKKIDMGRSCLDARSDVQKAFKSALGRAESETDEQIKPIAKRLIYYWSGEGDRHEKALQDTKKGISYCEECKDGKS